MTYPSGNNIDKIRLASLVDKFRKAPTATAADRSARDAVLDELQDAVGLGGRMVTENDVLRRADKMLQEK
jgi:hypothetical protein